MITSYSIW